MLDWIDYERFDWDASQQAAMSEDSREALEAAAAGIAGLADDERATPWGQCSPPGRFAATVVRIYPNVRHRFEDRAAALRIRDVGIKIYKSTPDALREADRARRLCDAVGRIPGIPNAHVQQTISAGEWSNGTNRRCYLVQEWVCGQSLEELLRRVWAANPVDGSTVRSLLEQLFGRIVVPLWSAGTIWWDFRDANYCWNADQQRLTMIDVDSLAAYTNEILDAPDNWTRRDKGRKTALARLRQMTLRILLSQGGRPKRRVESQLRRVWTTDFEPTLRRLGRDNQGSELATDQFLDCLAEQGLFLES